MAVRWWVGLAFSPSRSSPPADPSSAPGGWSPLLAAPALPVEPRADSRPAPAPADASRPQASAEARLPGAARHLRVVADPGLRGCAGRRPHGARGYHRDRQLRPGLRPGGRCSQGRTLTDGCWCVARSSRAAGDRCRDQRPARRPSRRLERLRRARRTPDLAGDRVNPPHLSGRGGERGARCARRRRPRRNRRPDHYRSAAKRHAGKPEARLGVPHPGRRPFLCGAPATCRPRPAAPRPAHCRRLARVAPASRHRGPRRHRRLAGTAEDRPSLARYSVRDETVTAQPSTVAYSSAPATTNPPPSGSGRSFLMVSATAGETSRSRPVAVTLTFPSCIPTSPILPGLSHRLDSPLL